MQSLELYNYTFLCIKSTYKICLILMHTYVDYKITCMRPELCNLVTKNIFLQKSKFISPDRQCLRQN